MNIVCSGGSWSALGTCERSACLAENLPNMAASHNLELYDDSGNLVPLFETTYTGEHNFGDILSYKCKASTFPESDRDLHLSIDVICLNTGQYDIPESFEQCLSSVKCGFPPIVIDNMVRNTLSTVFNFQESIEYDCEADYELVELASQDVIPSVVTTCQWDKSWSVANLSDLTCKPMFCDGANLSNFRDTHSLDVFYNNVVQLPDSSLGTYSFRVPFGSYVEYFCRDGTYPKSNKESLDRVRLPCRNDTTFGESLTVPIFECLDHVTCDYSKLPDPKANMLRSGSPNDIYRNGNWTWYFCSAGFALTKISTQAQIGKVVFFCHWNTNWSSSIDDYECRVSHCLGGDLPVLKSSHNLDLFYPTDTPIAEPTTTYSLLVPIGENASYKCAENTFPIYDHERNLEINVFCTDQGNFSVPSQFETCVSTKYCNISVPMDPIGDSQWDYDSVIAYQFEDRVSYVCNDPWFKWVSPEGQVSDIIEAICQWNETWANPRPDWQCQLPPGSCGYPPKIQDPSFDDPYSMHEFPLTMGQVVIYPCKEIGFTLDTDPLRTHMEAVCNVNQSYDFDFDPLPNCISDMECPPILLNNGQIQRQASREFMLPDKELWSADAMSIYQDQPILHGPLLAIDDILVTNTSGTFVGLHTSEEGDHYPRLRIDLPSFIGISKVIVYFGREECCSFLQNFEVRIGTNPDLGSDQSLNQENNTLCGNVTAIDDIQLNAAVIRCTYPIWGQYIFIQGLIKAEEQHFIVNEVSVYTLNISNSEPDLGDCEALFQLGATTPGTYAIFPHESGQNGINVYCENGWTNILQRGQFENNVDYFAQNLSHYISGFGSPNREFWIGLNTLHKMAQDLDVRLKIEMTNALGEVRRVYYDEFFVGSGPDYELTVGGFSVEEGREIGDHLSAMSGRKFSAKDRDYDEIDDKHCADYYQTSGWLGLASGDCMMANPFGQNWNTMDQPNANSGIFWLSNGGNKNSFSKFTMSIIPKSPASIDPTIREKWLHDLQRITEYRATNTLSCPFGQELELENGAKTKSMNVQCQFNGNWSSDFGACVWTHCIEPPSPPPSSNLILQDSKKSPIKVGESWNFICKHGMNSSGSLANAEVVLAVECQSGNTFQEPSSWPVCISGTFCPKLEPPITWNGTAYLDKIGLVRGPQCFSTMMISNQEGAGFCQDLKAFLLYANAFVGENTRRAQWNFIVPKTHDPTPLTVRMTFSLPIIVIEFNELSLVEMGSIPEELIISGSFSNFSSITVQYKPINGVDLCFFNISCHSSTALKANTADGSYDLQSFHHSGGTKVKFDCGLARQFLLPNGSLQNHLFHECGMNGQWMTPVQSMPPCVWIGCFDPPMPKNDSTLITTYINNTVISINGTITYKCKPGLHFEDDYQRRNFSLRCFPNGVWEPLLAWPRCIHPSEKKCGDPHDLVKFHEIPGSFNNTLVTANVSSFGQVVFRTCGPGMALQHVNGSLFEVERYSCLWNQTWSPQNAAKCIRTHCMTPPQPNHVNIRPVWDGNPIPFFDKIRYTCASPGLFFQEDRDLQSFEVECLEGGIFDVPKPWPACVRTTYCGAPLPEPEGGTREWNGDRTFGAEIEYTCGPFGQFWSPITNQTYEETIVTCQWNTTWSMEQLDRCVYSHCEHIPEPPVSSGMKFVPLPRSKLQLISPHSRFSPQEGETVTVTQEFGESDVFVAEGILSINLMNANRLPSFLITDINDLVAVNITLNPYQSILIVESDFLAGTSTQMYTSLSIGERFKLVVGFNRNRYKFNIKLNYEEMDDFGLPNSIENIIFKSAHHWADRTTRFIGFGHPGMDTYVPVGTTVTYKCPDGLFFDFDLLRKPFYALQCTNKGYFLHTPERWPTCKDPFTTTTMVTTLEDGNIGSNHGRTGILRLIEFVKHHELDTFRNDIFAMNGTNVRVIIKNVDVLELLL